MSSAEESKATVRRYVKNAVAGMRSGNLAATGDFLTSDATFYDPGQLSSAGTEAQKQLSAMLLGAFPNAPPRCGQVPRWSVLPFPKSKRMRCGPAPYTRSLCVGAAALKVA